MGLVGKRKFSIITSQICFGLVGLTLSIPNLDRRLSREGNFFDVIRVTILTPYKASMGTEFVLTILTFVVAKATGYFSVGHFLWAYGFDTQRPRNTVGTNEIE